MNIIFQIDGGLGKCIAATAVCKAIKKKYPSDKLIVVSGYPDVFFGNPNVDMNYAFNERLYFYQNHIKDQNIRMMVHNPYLESDFIAEKRHLIPVWCNMFSLEYDGEMPELFLNASETGFFSTMFQSDKPLFVVQTNGGGTDQQNKYSWARDLPIGTAQQIVNAVAGQYNVVHIRREDQPGLLNTTAVHRNFRALATLLLMSQKRLLIDSFAQHASAALNLPSVVCWIANNPNQYGYAMHTNILAASATRKPEMRHSVYTRFNISGDPTEFPYNSEAEIFNPETLYNALFGTLTNTEVKGPEENTPEIQFEESRNGESVVSIDMENN